MSEGKFTETYEKYRGASALYREVKAAEKIGAGLLCIAESIGLLVDAVTLHACRKHQPLRQEDVDPE